MTQAISGAMAQVAQAQAVKPSRDADGDNDGSMAAASSAAKIGPAVALSLSNVAPNDMAQGDPDHDGH
jgi:hypothetical protein